MAQEVDYTVKSGHTSGLRTRCHSYSHIPAQLGHRSVGPVPDLALAELNVDNKHVGVAVDPADASLVQLLGFLITVQDADFGHWLLAHLVEVAHMHVGFHFLLFSLIQSLSYLQSLYYLHPIHKPIDLPVGNLVDNGAATRMLVLDQARREDVVGEDVGLVD